MYRKPRTSVIDRHVLIELDGDFTDYEIGHLFRKAYENHKAPHEYDDLKKYIRDMVIGKHNSVYQQAGNPIPVAAAAVLMPSNTLNDGNSGNLEYDVVGEYNCPANYYFGFQLNSTCGDLPANNPAPWVLITYNNGTANAWVPIYTTSSLQNLVQSSTASCGNFYVFPSSSYFMVKPSSVTTDYDVTPTYITPNYLYAAYQTSTNPLTLSTYQYWTYSTSWEAATYSYVYFGTVNSILLSGAFRPVFILTFYSTGTFSFTPGTVYITMWQWTYT